MHDHGSGPHEHHETFEGSTPQGQSVLEAMKTTATPPHKYEMVGPGIMVTRDLVPWSEALVNLVADSPKWSPAKTIQKTDKPIRVNDWLSLTKKNLPEAETYENLFGGAVGKILLDWQKENPWLVAPMANAKNEVHDEGYDLLRYGEGQYYGIHVDSTPGTGFFARRVISIVAFLGGDCSGGALRFPHHKLKIDFEPGIIVSFPSNAAYPHEAMPVKKGTKFSLVTWLLLPT